MQTPIWLQDPGSGDRTQGAEKRVAGFLSLPARHVDFVHEAVDTLPQRLSGCRVIGGYSAFVDDELMGAFLTIGPRYGP